MGAANTRTGKHERALNAPDWSDMDNASAYALRGAFIGGAFVCHSSVFFDELDPMKMLHNTRYAVHVERATTALYYLAGFRWELDVEKNPDQFHAVRSFDIDFQSPLVGQREMEITLGVQKLGTTSCVYGFSCRSADGGQHARGTRTIVKLDPVTARPVEWSDRFRAAHRTLHAIEFDRDGTTHAAAPQPSEGA
jgi:acyl-CoA thioester hydrolase